MIGHLKVPVLAGIVLVKSAAMARYLNTNVPGVFVPDAIIQEMAGAKDRRAQSIEIASRLIKELKPMCQGVHIMPLGWNASVVPILDATGL